jgi:SMODS-associating 2TM, beta-strand rich effector domain
MIPSKHLSVLIALAAAIWAASLILGGVALPPGLLRPFSTVTGVLGLLLLAFDKYLWRIPFLHPWFIEMPNIRGVWKAEIRSNWVNPETGQRIGPIGGFMVIRQTYSSISMRLINRESASKLLAARILSEPDGLFCVTGVYSNEPKHSIRGRSPIHYGSLLLNIRSNPPTSLDGHYWTDRGTQGELRLTERRNAFPEDYDAAVLAFNLPSAE